MEIDPLTIISLVISYITTYSIVYFLYIYYTKNNEREQTLFHPGITMIIPALNEEANLKNCINSIREQDYQGPIEIIVVDDGSTDKTINIAKYYERKGVIKLIKKNKPGHPTGKISSVNLGIKKSKHSIIGVLDADSYLQKDAISHMVGEFENEKVAAVVPITKVHKPQNLLEQLQMIEYTMSMCIRKLISNTGSLFITHGVGTLFRKKALKDVGYFKENTLTEDLNIGLKLVKAGYILKSNFKSIGYTVVPNTIKHVIKQRLRWNGGLFENTYWFRDLIFNKEYGNTGLFVIPVNLVWSGFSIYIAIIWLKDFIKDSYYDLRNLILTNFDWNYFINNKLNGLMKLQLNELTILSIISLVMFLIFYTLVSRRIKLNIKESIMSYVLLPLYFTLFLGLNALSMILTPLYLKQKGGQPWLTDKVN